MLRIFHIVIFNVLDFQMISTTIWQIMARAYGRMFKRIVFGIQYNCTHMIKRYKKLTGKYIKIFLGNYDF